MTILDKSGILATTVRSVKLVRIPEWDGEVYVRQITGLERDEMDMAGADPDTMGATRRSMGGFRAKCAIYFLSDAEGNRLFPALSDWEQLAQLHGNAIDRIVDEGRKFNGMTAESMDGLEKNSEPESNGDIGSGLP